MCNACGNVCCGADMFGGCGCDGCDCEECWDDDEFEDDDAADDMCAACHGTGTVNPLSNVRTPEFFCASYAECPDCDGTGSIY